MSELFTKEIPKKLTTNFYRCNEKLKYIAICFNQVMEDLTLKDLWDMIRLLF